MMIKRVIQDRTLWFFLPSFSLTYFSGSFVIGYVTLYFSEDDVVLQLVAVVLEHVIVLVSGGRMFGVTLEGG